MSKKNNVKERILETASQLFYQQGFNSTGINQIIADAGIAIGSLYKHYPSKNDLLYHYLEKQEEEYFTNLHDYVGNEKNPLDRLFKLIDYRIDIQRNAGFSGCHFIKINAEISRQDKRLAEFVVYHKRKQRDYIDGIVTEIGLIQKILMEKDNLVNAIYLMIEGAVVSSSIHGNADDLEALKKSIGQFF